MAKKKKNSQKKGPEIERTIGQKIQEQADDVTESEVKAPEEETVQEPITEEVADFVLVDEPVAEVAEVTDNTIVMEPVAEEPAPAEEAAVTEPAAEEPAPAEASEAPEVPVPDPEEVTDFVLVDEPVAEVTDNTIVMEPVETTALAPVIPASAESEKAEAEKQGKKAQARENRARFFNKTVSMKMLAAALAAALVLNGAITAGIMGLYTKSIKGDISELNELVSELDKGNRSRDDYGSGFLPPDWNNGDNGWNDDWYGSPGTEPPDDQYGQRGSSGTSIGIVISDNDGVIITQVTGSNARKAGFETGDKIISFDGEDISDSNSLISEVQKHNSGDKVTVVVERNGKKVKIKTVLE